MKSQLSRASSIVAALVLLVALCLSSTAQQTTNRQRSSTQEIQGQEPQIPELAVQEVDPEALRIALPRQCHGIRPVVDTHDVADAFNPPGNAVSLSPGLQSFLSGKPTKGYDDSRMNRVFADSFKLRSCRVCYATLEVRVKHGPGAWVKGAPNYSNDTILAGVAPFPTALRFIGTADIWSSDPPNPKSLGLAISASNLINLNQYVFQNTPAYVDVIAQDDTDFDSATLSVWYY